MRTHTIKTSSGKTSIVNLDRLDSIHYNPEDEKLEFISSNSRFYISKVTPNEFKDFVMKLRLNNY